MICDIFVFCDIVILCDVLVLRDIVILCDGLVLRDIVILCDGLVLRDIVILCDVIILCDILCDVLIFRQGTQIKVFVHSFNKRPVYLFDHAGCLGRIDRFECISQICKGSFNLGFCNIIFRFFSNFLIRRRILRFFRGGSAFNVFK